MFTQFYLPTGRKDLFIYLFANWERRFWPLLHRKEFLPQIPPHPAPCGSGELFPLVPNLPPALLEPLYPRPSLSSLAQAPQGFFQEDAELCRARTDAPDGLGFIPNPSQALLPAQLQGRGWFIVSELRISSRKQKKLLVPRYLETAR